jgi:NitT/TauT family transport system ATP-binding protein
MRLFLELKGVALSYQKDDGLLAVSGLDLGVEQGQFAAIVGPSGCGKSTLMRLATGLRIPNRGTVTVKGAPVTGPLKIAGMGFQNSMMLPWRTTLQNVMLPLEIVLPHRNNLRRERKRYEAEAMELLRAVDLEAFAGHYPWQLSGGMQQRASLCRALIHKPELLLLDEPFAALDTFTREELWDVLKSVWLKRNFTVILVTHDLREAVYLSDIVHVMSARPGRITSTRQVTLPRQRDIEVTYTPSFVDMVHDLRSAIGHERSGTSRSSKGAM